MKQRILRLIDVQNDHRLRGLTTRFFVTFGIRRDLLQA